MDSGLMVANKLKEKQFEILKLEGIIEEFTKVLGEHNYKIYRCRTCKYMSTYEDLLCKCDNCKEYCCYDCSYRDRSLLIVTCNDCLNDSTDVLKCDECRRISENKNIFKKCPSCNQYFCEKYCFDDHQTNNISCTTYV